MAVRDGRPLRPPQPAEIRGLSDEIWELIQECWAVRPRDRPDMTAVLAQVEKIREFFESPIKLEEEFPDIRMPGLQNWA